MYTMMVAYTSSWFEIPAFWLLPPARLSLHLRKKAAHLLGRRSWMTRVDRRDSMKQEQHEA